MSPPWHGHGSWRGTARDAVVVEGPEDLGSVAVEAVTSWAWLAEGERLLPMKASAPNRARTTTATITAVPRRGRRFMEWRACRWARSVRDTGAPRTEGSWPGPLWERASSKTREPSPTGGPSPTSPTPASPGSFPGPPSGPTTLTEDWPDRAEMCSMVPNAEWYCRTEFRSLPRGRRSTETAATTVTTSTTTIRAAHIASIQPDAAGGRASRLRNGR